MDTATDTDHAIECIENPYVWDVARLLAKFGGISGLQEYLLACGVKPPPRTTMMMWRTRNAIPSPWLACLCHLGQRDGVISDMAFYAVDRQTFDPF